MFLALLIVLAGARLEECAPNQNESTVFRDQNCNCLGFTDKMGFELHIGFDFSKQRVYLCGGVSKRRTGWFAFGPGVSMNDGNAVVIIVHEDGSRSLRDLQPMVDIQDRNDSDAGIKDFWVEQDVVSGIDEKRFLSYSIPLKTFTAASNSIIYAVGKTKKRSKKKLTKHTDGNRASKEVALPGKIKTPTQSGKASSLKGIYEGIDIIQIDADETFQLHFGQPPTRSLVKFCAVNMLGDGWLSVAPADGGMDPNTHAIIAFGSEEVETATMTTTGIGSKKEMAITDVQTGLHQGKRYVCWTTQTNYFLSLSKRTKLEDMPFTFGVSTDPRSPRIAGKHTKKGTKTFGNKTILAKIPLWLWTHMLAMGVAFVVLMPVGVLVAVSAAPGFITGAKWFSAHRACMSLAVMFAVFGFLSILIHKEGNLFTLPGDTFSGVHGYFGIATFILTIFQPINATFRVGKEHKRRRRWEFLHKGLGRITVFGGILVCIMGTELYNGIAVNRNATIVVTTVGFIMMVLFVYLRVEQYRRMSDTKRSSLNKEKKKQLALLQHQKLKKMNTASEEIQETGMKKRKEKSPKKDIMVAHVPIGIE